MNKKALDQYTNFTEQREELARRQTENGRGEDKIKLLIQTLDTRKDEAVERTFKVGCRNLEGSAAAVTGKLLMANRSHSNA